MLPGRDAQGLGKAMFLGFWALVFPLAVVALIFGVGAMAGPDGVTPASVVAVGFSLAILLLAVRWWMEVRGQQIRAGTWKNSVRAGLGVGAAIAVAELLRAMLGDG